MSLWGPWTQPLRAPRIVTTQSWLTARPSRPTHMRVQIPYRAANLRLGSQKHWKRQHFAKAYSNYAPRGPSQYYGAYGQPPKSGASRLKDMAIGSVLTIAVYSVYVFYHARKRLQEMRGREDMKNELGDIFPHYERLLTKAEKEDDGSAESAEKIHRLFKERAVAIMHVGLSKQEKDQFVVRDMGPLPRFPQGHRNHGKEMVRDEDTLVLMPPPVSEEELAEIPIEDRARTIIYSMVLAINDHTENFQVKNGPIHSGPANPKFYELECRLVIVIDSLYQEGALDPSMPTLVSFFWRDAVLQYVYKSRTLRSLGQDKIGFTMLNNIICFSIAIPNKSQP
ncbi:hypothetical protein F4859DRAFT_439065 [Xylaria cf. heliscus]|nr:hypothetical protein F4859DRAFT_439065 [Xylaria cf. heliscus]